MADLLFVFAGCFEQAGGEHAPAECILVECCAEDDLVHLLQHGVEILEIERREGPDLHAPASLHRHRFA